MRPRLSLFTFLALFVASALAGPVFAAEGAWGRLVLRDSLGHEVDPLEVRGLRVHVQIAGPIAFTEIEETFFNSTDRRAEGIFYFPVPAGASLCRLAMYVDGQLVEGELVERTRARQVYEEIVRRMQDPALMEWQEGNVFKTRIFPIPPRGPKRILIAYSQVLPIVDGARRYVYPLVSKATQAVKIGQFDFRAEIADADPAARVEVPAFRDAQVTTEKDSARVAVARRDFQPEQDLVVRYVPRRSAPLELYADRRAGEDGFFLLSYLPPGDGGSGAPPRTGRDAVLLFDTSLSRRAGDYRAQLAAARELLLDLGPQDRFAVITFDVVARPLHKSFAQGPEAVAAALKELEALLPLGATNLEAAFDEAARFLAANPSPSRPDVICLSDGIATLGETSPERLVRAASALLARHGARFHAVALGTEQDRSVLRELARATGGLFRTLSPGDDIPCEVNRLCLALGATLLPAPEVTFGGGEVRGLYPAHPGTLIAGEELIILGSYATPGRLAVAVRQPGGGEWKAEFELPETASRYVFVPQLWARERLDALLLEPQTAQTVKAVTDLSLEFTLITPYTSFLVLENEKAYEQYGISRQKRRRYWEERGKLRSAPPPEEVRVAERPRREPPTTLPPVSPPSFAAVPAPKPFSLGDLNLGLALDRYTNGREIATALSCMCLEVYYRYLPTYGGISGGGGGWGGGGSGVRTDAPLRGGSGSSEATRQTPTPSEPVSTTAARTPEPRPRPLIRAPSVPNEQEAGRPSNLSVTGWFVNRSGSATVSQPPNAGGGGSGGVRLEDVIGVGADSGAGSGSFGLRSGGGRRLMVVRHGGSRASESAVDRADCWLARAQRPEGNWGQGGIEETALPLLALLGAGHTEKVGQYKANVKGGVAWLTAHQNSDGQIGANAYDHALATVALSEAAGMGKIPATVEAAQKVVNRLVALQVRVGGERRGWGESDDRCHALTTIWAVMALRSAKIAGLRVDHEAFEGVIRYLDEIQDENGMVGAAGRPTPGEVHLLHTAGVGLARQFLGWRREDPKVFQAAELLGKRVTGGVTMPSDGLYLRYFGTLVMFQQGGDLWRAWNDWNKKNLMDLRCSEGDLAGSWDPDGIWVRGRMPQPETKEDPAGEISAALARAVREPEHRIAHEELAAALAWADNVPLIHMLLPQAAQAPKALALLHFRAGVLHQQAQRKDRAVSEFQAAYEAGGKPPNLLSWYLDALEQAGEIPAALALLAKEAIEEDEVSAWRLQTMASYLLRVHRAPSQVNAWLDAHLKDRVDLKSEVKLRLAREAGKGGEWMLAAGCYEDLYLDNGRPEELFQPYVEALLKAGKEPAKAAEELERALRGGFHTPWAFGALNNAYRALGRTPAERLRAASNEVELFPRDPQPQIALADFLEATGDPRAAALHYAAAARLRPEDAHFGELALERALKHRQFAAAREVLELLARHCPNAPVLQHENAQQLLAVLKDAAKGSDAAAAEQEIRRFLSKDLVVVLTWDTQGTDVDLHVTEPDGQECSYNRTRTASGGALDRDKTDGLGPETYAIRRAAPGVYKIEVEYFHGSAPTTVTVRVTRHSGLDTEQTSTSTAKLTNQKQRVTVATLEIKP